MEKEFGALIEQNKTRLNRLEQRMATGAREVAICLKEIHDEQLWMDGVHTSFEDYCLRKLGLSRAGAFRILQAKTVRELLTNSIESVDQLSDKAVIELSKSDQAAKILKEIAKTGDKPTAKRIRLEVSPEQEQPKVCPTCKRPL